MPTSIDRPARYRFGAFQLDESSRLLTRDGERIPLPSKAFDVLLILLRHEGRLVSKDEIQRVVWPDVAVTDETLTQTVFVLRKAVGDSGGHPRIIGTVARHGYRVLVPVIENPPDLVQANSLAERQDEQTEQANPGPVREPIRRIDPSVRFVPGRTWALLGCLAAVALIATIARPYLLAGTPTPRRAHPIRFTHEMPQGLVAMSRAVVSPNGRYLAFTAQASRGRAVQLWVTELATGVSRSLADTEGAFRPFWSPDSQALAFFAAGQLKRVGLSGGKAKGLARIGSHVPRGGTWSPSGLVVYSERNGGLRGVNDHGTGDVVQISTLAVSDIDHTWPHFLPDGRHYLFSIESREADRAGIYVGEVGTASVVKVADVRDAAAVYARPGFIIYTDGGTVVAQRFDAETCQVQGPRVILAEHTAPAGSPGAVLSASDDGIISFGSALPGGRLSWVDRAGRHIQTVDLPFPVQNPRLSWDDSRVLVSRFPDQNEVWVVDLERAQTDPVSIRGVSPIWAPDDRRVAIGKLSSDVSSMDIYSLAALKSGTPVIRTPEQLYVNDWSSDGSAIVYSTLSPASRLDLWWVSLVGADGPRPFARGLSNEMQGQLSPDGKWLAYSTDESGRWEVHLDSFPDRAVRTVVSRDGGAEPHWRRDGRELFYIATDGMLTSVELTVSGGKPVIGESTPLFEFPIFGSATSKVSHYAVSSNGRRFLINTTTDKTVGPATILVDALTALPR